MKISWHSRGELAAFREARLTGCVGFGACGVVALAPSRLEAAELFAEAEHGLGAAPAGEPVGSLAGIS
jgi:hypothetical protein